MGSGVNIADCGLRIGQFRLFDPQFEIPNSQFPIPSSPSGCEHAAGGFIIGVRNKSQNGSVYGGSPNGIVGLRSQKRFLADLAKIPEETNSKILFAH